MCVFKAPRTYTYTPVLSALASPLGTRAGGRSFAAERMKCDERLRFTNSAAEVLCVYLDSMTLGGLWFVACASACLMHCLADFLWLAIQ